MHDTKDAERRAAIIAENLETLRRDIKTLETVELSSGVAQSEMREMIDTLKGYLV